MWQVWVTTTEDPANETPLARYTFSEVERVRGELAQIIGKRFCLAESAARADIILFVESPLHKFLDYAQRLRSNELIRTYPNKCFAYDHEDNPAGFLPGVYPSLLRQKEDPTRLRSGFYSSPPYGNFDAEIEEARKTHTPKLLASFRGAMSHPIREKLLTVKFDDLPVVVASLEGSLQYAKTDRTTYSDLLLDSKFVICPRGQGTNTFRLVEVMGLGRVPVVLSDDWIPPLGPAWSDCILHLAEDRLHELPKLLAEWEPRWREMGETAYEVWKDWLQPIVTTRRNLEIVEQILLRRSSDHDERAFQEKWTSWNFAWDNGWTVPQKAANRLKRTLSTRP